MICGFGFALEAANLGLACDYGSRGRSPSNLKVKQSLVVSLEGSLSASGGSVPASRAGSLVAIPTEDRPMEPAVLGTKLNLGGDPARLSQGVMVLEVKTVENGGRVKIYDGNTLLIDGTGTKEWPLSGAFRMENVPSPLRVIGKTASANKDDVQILYKYMWGSEVWTVATEKMTVKTPAINIVSFLAAPGSEPGDPETVVLGYDKGRVTYKSEPTDFTADTAELKIKNKNDVLVSKTDLTGKTGGITYTYDWDGKWNQSPNDTPAIYTKPDNGPYKAQITITKGNLTCNSNEDTVKTKGKVIVEGESWWGHAQAATDTFGDMGFDDVHTDIPPVKTSGIAKAPNRLCFYFYGHCRKSSGTWLGMKMPDNDNVLTPADLPSNLDYEVVFINGCYSFENPTRANFISKFSTRTYIGWGGTGDTDDEPTNLEGWTAGQNFMNSLYAGNTVYNAYLAALPSAPHPFLAFTGDGSQKVELK